MINPWRKGSSLTQKPRGVLHSLSYHTTFVINTKYYPNRPTFDVCQWSWFWLLRFSLPVTGPSVTKVKARKVLRLVMVTVTLKFNPNEMCIKFDLQATENTNKYILSHCLIHWWGHQSCIVLKIFKSINWVFLCELSVWRLWAVSCLSRSIFPVLFFSIFTAPCSEPGPEKGSCRRTGQRCLPEGRILQSEKLNDIMT